MADIRVRCSAVPDDGSNGVFWRDGMRYLRDKGEEQLIASLPGVADREKKFMADMDGPLGFTVMRVEREAREMSRLGPMDRERMLYTELEGILSRYSMPLDDFLSLLAKVMRDDAATQTEPTVKACLEGAAESLDMASLDWYASTK